MLLNEPVWWHRTLGGTRRLPDGTRGNDKERIPSVLLEKTDRSALIRVETRGPLADETWVRLTNISPRDV